MFCPEPRLTAGAPGRPDRRVTLYTGYGLVLGAALGLLVGTLLSSAVWLGPLIGASVGLIVGAIFDAQQPKNGKG